ncbi:MAG: hypothetical protein Q4G55_07415 [bacterium]|nr:hypothetical protein [bacterium]
MFAFAVLGTQAATGTGSVDFAAFVDALKAANNTFDGSKHALAQGGKLTVKWSPVSGCYDKREGHECTVGNVAATANTPKRVNSGLTQFQLFEGESHAVNVKNVAFVYEPSAFTVCENSRWNGSFTADDAPAGQIYLMNTGDVTFEGCSFDKVVLTSFNCTGTSTVKDCSFKNVYNSYAVKDIRGAKVAVTGCTFENCGAAVMVSMVSSTVKVGAVTISGNTFKNVDVAGTAPESKVGTRGLVQIASSGDYADTAFDFSDNTATDCGPVLRQLNSTVSFGTEEKAQLNTLASAGGSLYTTDSIKRVVAKVGETAYETLDEAIEAVQDGETIVVNAGEYKLNGSLTYTGKAFTIQAAEGATVSFDMSAAVALHGAKITFSGVTFNYKTNKDYTGLQHADTLVYNDCTVNGKVFLYAASETFNRCTFVQEVEDYNVWTYGAKSVTFTDCTFKNVGKTINAYIEGGNASSEPQKIEMADCTVESSKSNKAVVNIKNKTQAYDITLTGKNEVSGIAVNETTKSAWYQVETTDSTDQSCKAVSVTEVKDDGTKDVVYVVKPYVAAFVTVTGIAGFADRKYASFAEAYAAIKPTIEKLGLVQESATADAFDALFTSVDANGNATLTYTISGTVVYDETVCTNLLTMGRKASHYGNGRHLINFKFVGATGKDADTLTVNSDITLPYEWWSEKTTTGIHFENLTITGSAPSGLYPSQKFFEGIDFSVTKCALKGIKIYNCSNVKGSYTITDSVLDGTGAPANSYAIHLQGNETAPLSINIKGNTISGYDRGINIDQKTAVATIERNTISVKDAGRSCIQLSSLATADIVGNTLELTGGNAITLHENLLTLSAAPKVSISGNTVTGTGYLIYDDAKANDKEFTSDNLKLTYATDNTIAETVDTTKGVKGSTAYITSTAVNNEVQHYVAQVGTTGYTTLAAACAALNAENHTLTLLNENAWDATTPAYWAAGAQSGYAATLAKALTAAYKANEGAITIVCRPGADVGEMTHGHVADDLTIYGNDAYLSGGECDLEVDTYTFSRETGKLVTSDGVCLDKDITITAYELDNLGVWGERHTANKVTVNLTDCDGKALEGKTNVQRVYISGTTGVNDITLTGCDFLTKATAVYSNADGAIKAVNCSFTGGQVPFNINHKANGTQTVAVENCTFTNCGDAGDWKQFAAPLRLVNSGTGTQSAEVTGCAFADTVGANGDILLGDGRTGQASNDVELKVVNTAANIQAQKPGYYKDETVDETKMNTAASPAGGTLETSIAKLLPVNDGSEARPYSREQFAAMTRADYIKAQERLGGTLYVNVGNYAYEKNGVLGNGVRDDTTGQIPDHSKLNAYGENGYLGEGNDDANGHAVVFVGGTIASGVTGYTSIDSIGTSLLLAVPAYTKVTFKKTTFKNVLSFNYQLYTSPWSQLGGLTFNGCTFDGIIVGAIASQELAFNGCTFNDYVNTTSANNSNPTWIRPAYGNWTKGDNEGQGTDFRSLTKITFENNTVTSTRPVKFERIAQWEMATTVTATNNTFAITPQEGDKEEKKTKNVGLYFGANAKFDLVIDQNEKSDGTAALYTAEYKAPTEVTYVGLPAGSTVKNAAGEEVATGDALAWKTTDKITLKTTTEVASVTNATGVSVNFATLSEAVKAAQAGETVTLLADITLASKQSIRKELTLDLNGKTLTGTAYQTLSLGSGANVTIQDSSAEKTGKVANGYEGRADPYTICLDGDDAAALTLVSGTVEANPHKTDLQSVAINTNNQKDGPYAINIRGGKVFVPESSTNGRAIVAGKNVTLTVEGGEIVGGLHGVDVYGGSTTVITGGSISARVVDTGVIEAAYGLRATGKASVTIGAADGTADVVSVAGIKMDDDGYKLNVPVVTVNSGTIAGPVYSITKGTIGFTVQATSEDVLRFADDTAAKFLPSDLELRAKDIDGKTMYYVAAKPVAAIGAIGYATLADAIAAAKDGETVKLLADVNGDGIAIAPNTFKTGLTVDFGGHTYTVGGLLVGSSGTASNGFQLNAGNRITFKNGAIVGATATAGAGTDWKGAPAILIQNYCDLTLEQMTVKGGDETCYTLSNNNGEIVIDGSTIVAGKGTKYGPFAFDVCRYANYPSVHVTVKGASVIEGNVEISGTIGDNQSRQLDIEGVTFKGAFKVVNQPANIAISGGTFSDAVLPEYCAAGFIPTKNADGTYGVKEGAYVAQIGTVGYETLEAALAAAKDGETVKMLADVVLTEKQTIAKAVVLDLNGKTISSTVNQFITIAKGGDLTVNDATGEGRIENTVTDSSSGRVIFMEGGVLTVNGGTLASNSSKASYYATIEFKNDSYSTVNIAGGRIESIRTANHADGAIKVNAVARATVNVSGGEIVGSKGGIHCLNAYSTINISDGTIIGKNGNAVYSGPYNTITVSGGTLTPGGTAAALAIGGGSCTVTIGREGGVVGDVTIPSIDFEPGYSVNAATVYLFSGIVQKFLDWDKMTVKEPVSQGKDTLLVGTDITACLPGSDLLCQLDAASGLYEIVKLTVENAAAIVTHDDVETPYHTVEQACKAVTDGDTLTLKVDHTGSQTLSFSAKNVTVDLGGKTLTYTGATGGLSSALSFNQSTASDNTVTVKNGTIVAKAQDATCVRAEMTGDLSKTLTVVFGENLTLTSGNTSRYGGVVFGTGARTASPCEKMTKGGLLVMEGEEVWIYGETATAFTHAKGSEVTLLNDWYDTDTKGTVKVPSSGTFASAKLNLNGHTINSYGVNPAVLMGMVGENEDTAAKTLEISSGTIKTFHHGAAVCGSNKTLTLDGVTLTTTGDKMYGLYANGMTSGNTVTLKNKSAVLSEKATGIYFPGAGTLTVEDSNVTGGVSGIEVRAGVLNVSGTSVIESTATAFDFTNNDNGITTTGAAVAAVKHTVGNDLAVTITGGTFKGPRGFYANDPNEAKPGTVTVSISGGVFSTDVEKKYLADGCKTVQQTIDGTLYYVVGPANTQIEVTLGGKKKEMPFPDAWLVANIGADAATWTTAALEEKAANELAKWQCYLFGLDPNKKEAKVVATAGQGTDEAIPLTVANADASASPLVTGGYVTVAYVLMGSNDGTAWTRVATSDKRDGLAIPLTDTTYKFYRVDVTVTSAEGN